MEEKKKKRYFCDWWSKVWNKRIIILCVVAVFCLGSCATGLLLNMFAKIDWTNALITGAVVVYTCMVGIFVVGQIASDKSAKNKKEEEENERLQKRQKDREEYYRKFAEYQDRVLK